MFAHVLWARRVSSPPPIQPPPFDSAAMVDAIQGLQTAVAALGAGRVALAQRFNDAGCDSFWVFGLSI